MRLGFSIQTLPKWLIWNVLLVMLNNDYKLPAHVKIYQTSLLLTLRFQQRYMNWEFLFTFLQMS